MGNSWGKGGASIILRKLLADGWSENIRRIRGNNDTYVFQTYVTGARGIARIINDQIMKWNPPPPQLTPILGLWKENRGTKWENEKWKSKRRWERNYDGREGGDEEKPRGGNKGGGTADSIFVEHRCNDPSSEHVDEEKWHYFRELPSFSTPPPPRPFANNDDFGWQRFLNTLLTRFTCSQYHIHPLTAILYRGTMHTSAKKGRRKYKGRRITFIRMLAFFLRVRSSLLLHFPFSFFSVLSFLLKFLFSPPLIRAYSMSIFVLAEYFGQEVLRPFPD